MVTRVTRHPPGHPEPCYECGPHRPHPSAVAGKLDPATGRPVFVALPCGHHVDRDYAVAGWHARISTAPPPLTGINLIGAEHTERPSDLDGVTNLAWAVWCLLDYAAAGGPPGDVPSMWPWEDSAWTPVTSPVRALTLAGELIAAELDRRLHTGETP